MAGKSGKTAFAGFVIFTVVLIFLTAAALFATFWVIDQNVGEVGKTDADNGRTDPALAVGKPEAQDGIFGLKSYRETYDENALSIQQIEDEYLTYVQIQGLKDKEIEEDINGRLKALAYGMGAKNVYSYVSGNFSNVLSVVIYGGNDFGEEKLETFTVDLRTGKEIPFEQVFVSSAPLHMLLANALYETLAWAVDIPEDSWNLGFYYDMDNRDTSEYEDKFLMLINRYEREKGNLRYSISPEGVHVYGLTDGIVENHTAAGEITIKFLNCMEEVAVYKRFLSKESLFEDDSLGQKNLIVMTDYSIFRESDYYELMSCGMLNENIFLEETVTNCSLKEENEKIQDFIEQISGERKRAVAEELRAGQGMIFQIRYSVDVFEDAGYYTIYVQSAKAVCDEEYFQEKAFKDYIRMKSRGGEMGVGNMFYDFSSTDELKIENEYEAYYFDLDFRPISESEKERLDELVFY